LRRLIVAEPVARSAVWARRLSIFALAIAAVALAVSWLRAADPPAVLTVFGASLVVAALAALLAIAAAAVIWRDGLRGAQQATFGFALAAALVAYPVYLAALAFALPPIAEVSTDLKSPPTFLLSAKAREARASAEPPPLSDETRATQLAAYPDIETVMVEMDSTEAYQLALRVAGDLGWRVVDSEPPNLNGDGAALIEATARSLFFGFISDIAIRIRPGATETAIDVRSVSRVGGHDFGSNARRVRKFIAAAKVDSREP
jgi:uncharacterized protein (DUF1499 family)